jgi:hypothetical protein
MLEYVFILLLCSGCWYFNKWLRTEPDRRPTRRNQPENTYELPRIEYSKTESGKIDSGPDYTYDVLDSSLCSFVSHTFYGTDKCVTCNKQLPDKPRVSSLSKDTIKAFDEILSRPGIAHAFECDIVSCRKEVCYVWQPDRIVGEPYNVHMRSRHPDSEECKCFNKGTE